MIGNVYYNEDKFRETADRICKCGHKLLMHAFTTQYEPTTDSHYLRTSQCTSCGWEDDEPVCPHFR